MPLSCSSPAARASRFDACEPDARPIGVAGLAAVRMARLPCVVALLLAAATGPGCGPPAVGSVGAVLARDRETGALHVREAPDGLAAADAGLLPGDQIKMIDGVLADELDQEQIRARLRGEVGTTVRLTVIRGSEVLHVELVRQPMRAASAAPPPEQPFEP